MVSPKPMTCQSSDGYTHHQTLQHTLPIELNRSRETGAVSRRNCRNHTYKYQYLEMASPEHGPDDTVTSTAADTIELLETRLRRLEYLLTGNASWSGEPIPVSPGPVPQKESVSSRLAALEHGLRGLGAKVPAVKDVLRLCTSNTQTDTTRS